MPEFVALILSLFLIPIVFYVFGISIEYLEETFLVVGVILLIPMLKTLGSAPFVPSKKERVDAMLKLADLKPSDKVWELGCGDGRIIRSAARKGVAEAVGYEISLPLIAYTRIVSFIQRLPVSIQFQDIWKLDYKNVDVVFCYLLTVAMKRFEAEIWPTLKPGTRVVSNAFPMKGIKEDSREGNVYLYIKK